MNTHIFCTSPFISYFSVFFLFWASPPDSSSQFSLTSCVTTKLLNIFVPQLSHLLGRDNSIYFTSLLRGWNVLEEGLEQSKCYRNFCYYVLSHKRTGHSRAGLSVMSLLTPRAGQCFPAGAVPCREHPWPLPPVPVASPCAGVTTKTVCRHCQASPRGTTTLTWQPCFSGMNVDTGGCVWLFPRYSFLNYPC